MSAKTKKLEQDFIDDNELYDKKHEVSNKIRIENLINVENLPQPQENSLAEMIFLNRVDELKKRLENKEDPNQRDELGRTITWTPLYWCVKLGNMECATILLNHGADLRMVVNDSEECFGTVLDLVVLRGDEPMEKLLKEFAEASNVVFGQPYKAIRTRLRGKAPACSFKFNGRKKD